MHWILNDFVEEYIQNSLPSINADKQGKANTTLGDSIDSGYY